MFFTTLLTSVAIFSSVEHPERPHEGGEDAGEGGGALHEHAHRGIVHLQEFVLGAIHKGRPHREGGRG